MNQKVNVNVAWGANDENGHNVVSEENASQKNAKILKDIVWGQIKCPLHTEENPSPYIWILYTKERWVRK